MIAFDEAIVAVVDAAQPLGVEQVNLADANGRRLVEPAISMVDHPPADVSAMDGYAIFDEDLAALPVTLPVDGEAFAGDEETSKLSVGTCRRIFTGGRVPAGASRVVIQENVERTEYEVKFSIPLSDGRNIRKKGSDFRCGDVLLDAGAELNFRSLVAVAGGDLAQLTCWKKPRIAIAATGDELVKPGTARGSAHTIPESVSIGVSALAEQYGGEVVSCVHLPDDLARMQSIAEKVSSEADLVIVTGGASVGDRDFAKAMFSSVGLEIRFSKVSIKPGKPVWLARAGKTLVLGLPGNPASAMVTARLLMAPLITGLAGGDPLDCLKWEPRKLGCDIPAIGDRDVFIRAYTDEDGLMYPIGNQDSGAQRPLVDAAYLLRQPAGDTGIAAGGEILGLQF